MPPPSAPLLTSYISCRMLSALSNVVTVNACCSIVIVNSHKPPAPDHHVQRCKCNQSWSCACLYAHDQTRPSSFLLQVCQVQCLCTCIQAQYPLMSCPYAVDVTFSFSKTIMMFDVFHYIQILEILRRNVSVPAYKLNTR